VVSQRANIIKHISPVKPSLNIPPLKTPRPVAQAILPVHTPSLSPLVSRERFHRSPSECGEQSPPYPTQLRHLATPAHRAAPNPARAPAFATARTHSWQPSLRLGTITFAWRLGWNRHVLPVGHPRSSPSLLLPAPEPPVQRSPHLGLRLPATSATHSHLPLNLVSRERFPLALGVR
jgi:hypothetical protein